MNKRNGNLINVIATGIIVTVLFSLALFWVRLFLNYHLLDNLPEGSLQVIIRPSGLVPGEPAPQQSRQQERTTSIPPGSNEPDTRFSQVYTDLSGENILFSSVGRPLLDIIEETIPLRDANEKVYYWYNQGNYVCLDKRTGLMNRRYASESGGPMKDLYAGPNGVSETPSASLGRFYDPIINRGWGPNLLGFYDKTLRQFFVIDLIEGSVNKGLQLEKGDNREPIALGNISKGEYTAVIPYPVWSAPEKWNAAEEKWEQQKLFLPVDAKSNEEYRYSGWDRSYPFIPVLDKTGRIYNYNTKEHSLVQVGHLPRPRSVFSTGLNNEAANPRDVLGYNVWQLYAVRRLPAEPKKQPKIIDVRYLGMSTACVSREGVSMTVAVFDPNGKLIYRGNTKANKDESVTDTVYADSPGASFWTAVEFLLENLQPAAFELTSYLCGNCFEAAAGHGALFILPNSFIGTMGRVDDREDVFSKQVEALMLMGPSLILSVWLARKVRKDAVLVGLSREARKWWIIGTIAFGLPAYITYRLTRHKEVLVTCQNCGYTRRPDMETCHRCGSKWEVPDLTPPNWRICD
jgi:hypothetical protein